MYLVGFGDGRVRRYPQAAVIVERGAKRRVPASGSARHKSNHVLHVGRDPASRNRAPTAAPPGNPDVRHGPARKAATVLRLRQRKVGFDQGRVRCRTWGGVCIGAPAPATVRPGQRLRPGIPIADKPQPPKLQNSEDECHRLSRVVPDAFPLYAKNESSCSGGFVCLLACVEFGLHLAQRQLSLQFIFKRLSLPNRGTDKPAKKSNESDQNGRIGR